MAVHPAADCGAVGRKSDRGCDEFVAEGHKGALGLVGLGEIPPETHNNIKLDRRKFVFSNWTELYQHIPAIMQQPLLYAINGSIKT